MIARLFADTEPVAPQQDLAQLETIIERGLETFVDVGMALLAIRDRKLYKQGHFTFEEYCKERWGFVASRARQLIGAAEVARNLESVTSGNTLTERQVRPLVGLEPEQQREAYAKAVETAPDGKVTAAHVQRVVDEYDEQAEELSEEPDGYDWTDEEPEPAPVTTIEYDSDEWYTPIEFIEAARQVMGSIDLDPASSHAAQKIVQAGAYHTQEDDGLAQEWTAKNVWLNPPYSEPRPWVEKAIECLEAGSIECAILLVNTANSPLWARPLWHGPYAVCLLDRRVRFWRPDRPDAKGFDRDQMIWYLGSDVGKFRSVFGVYGAIR